VYYAISSSITGTELAAVQAGIASWNSQSGLTTYAFEPASEGSPATLTIDNSTTGNGYFGWMTPSYNANGTLQSALIEIYINATISAGVPVFDPSDPGYSAAIQEATEHEIGHTMGLDDMSGDCGDQWPGGSVMDYLCGTNDITDNMALTVTTCDASTAGAYSLSTGTGGGGGGGGPVGCQHPCGTTACMDGMTCGEGFNAQCLDNTPQCVCTIPCGENMCLSAASCENGEQPECEDEDEGWMIVCPASGSPIVIDAFGEGFHLTSVPGGVQFRLLPTDPLEQMSWTDQKWRNGWLALDRNGNGRIDNFTELFGNLTPQQPSTEPNGYIALAVFDDPAYGGNGNGVIDPGDAVYDHLLLWIDANHNGISEPNELYHLRDVGIFRIDLSYQLVPYVNQYGDQFRYKAKIWDESGQEHGMCYDVFLQVWGKPTQH
jgi:hypothetical protein